MRSNPRKSFIAAVAASLARHGNAQSVDLSWHAPNATAINDLTQAIGGSGVYGFIYNSSTTPDGAYGTYNWCNMPHVRATEYKKPSSEYKLQYVEVVSRAVVLIAYPISKQNTSQLARLTKRETLAASQSFLRQIN
jgi:acid phosphatase